MIGDLVRRLGGVRFVGFLLAGGVNVAFSYSFFAALIFLGVHYAIASGISTVASVIFNFFVTGQIVFDRSSPREFFRFILLHCCIYLLGVAELKLGLLVGSNHYITAAVMLLPNAILTYFLLKSFVFVQSRERAGSAACADRGAEASPPPLASRPGKTEQSPTEGR